MKKLFSSLKGFAIISFLLVLPFMILELVNRRGYGEEFPVLLFVFLWLLGSVFVFILLFAAAQIRKRNRPGFKLILGSVILFLVAVVWVSLARDQMPCFLGSGHCD